MKKINIIIAVLCIAVMAVALSACGGDDKKPADGTTAAVETQATGNNETEAASEAVTEAASEAVSEAVSEVASEAASEEAVDVDYSNPSIIIEYGDAAAIEDLAKQAQNFDIEEGTVVQISGVFSSGISTPSITEATDSGYIGVNMYVDGEWEAPADKSDIDVVGVFQKGSFNMEFHVLPENITVK